VFNKNFSTGAPIRGLLRVWFARFCLVMAGLFAYCVTAHAQVSEALLLQVATKPQWSRLLHLNERGVSEITSQTFFLAPDGREHAVHELRATLDALQQPWTDKPDDHPRCRFPARYLWLSQQIELPGYIKKDPRCVRLEQWARLSHLQSISIYLVSGYFGNPASTFGHAFVKFNTDDGKSTHGLLDMSVGFGALVPDNELTALYVYRGLFGGYKAGFSDKEHYHNDVMYGHTEFRDMWDFELALTDTERELFVLHVAEVAGKKFDYFFLNKNCATRIGELIEAATGRTILRDAKFWYMPIELFHALENADALGPKLLSKQPRFIPSAERVMHREFARLSPKQARSAKAIFQASTSPIDEHLSDLDVDEKKEVLNSVLAYHEFALTKAGPEASPELHDAKNTILLARLKLPPNAKAPNNTQPISQPPLSHAPMLFEWGLGHDQATGSALNLRWAMSGFEFNGFHGIEHGELVVLDTHLTTNSHQALHLKRLDLIKLRKLEPVNLDIAHQWPLSWQVRLGSEQKIAGKAAQRMTFDLGAGWAVQWLHMTAFTMLGGGVQNSGNTFFIDPQLGVSGGRANFRWVLEMGAKQTLDANHHTTPHLKASISWRLSRDQSISMALKRDYLGRAVNMAFQNHW
jgi:Domain of unknown function (DUF4105)